MTKTQNPGSGAALAVLAMLVLVALALGATLVFGVGAVLYFRTATRSQAEAVQAQQAVVEAMRPRELEYQTQAEPAVATAIAGQRPLESAVRELLVEVDAEGKLRCDAQTLDLSQLRERFQRECSAGRLHVVLAVDSHCRFEHVSAVQDLCVGLGIADIQVRAAAPR